jgi:hypothetical protein
VADLEIAPPNEDIRLAILAVYQEMKQRVTGRTPVRYLGKTLGFGYDK